MITKKKEFLVFKLYPLLLVLLVGITAVLSLTFRTSYSEKYKIFRSNARTFALTIGRMNIYRDRDKVSLLELIDSGYLAHIKNPFLGGRYCNIVDSYLTMRGAQIYTTLRCGNYLISDQNIGETYFNIYRITIDWQEERPRGNRQYIDSILMYNYQADNMLVYERFYPKEVFLYRFNRKHKTSYENINDIPLEFNIIERRFYRQRRLAHQIEA